MKWIKKIPEIPGIYLRRNPSSSFVVRQDCFLINEELCINSNGVTIRLKYWGGAKRMWWFGQYRDHQEIKTMTEILN